jgi:hypothetical protein
MFEAQTLLGEYSVKHGQEMRDMAETIQALQARTENQRRGQIAELDALKALHEKQIQQIRGEDNQRQRTAREATA